MTGTLESYRDHEARSPWALCCIGKSRQKGQRHAVSEGSPKILRMAGYEEYGNS